METKFIPFDLETAKKIQSGEIKGKILDNLKNEVRIVCFDREDAVAPIIALFKVDGGEGVMYVRNDGHATNCRDILILEVPDYVVEEIHTGSICFLKDSEPREPQFKPFDRVLVRKPYISKLCIPINTWIPGIFQYENTYNHLYFVSGQAYWECIPYIDNEHLIGTTDKPKED